MPTITVSVLYFGGCPNHLPTVESVRRAADRLGINVRIEQIDVPGPDRVQALRFLGSPTVQVNGLDAEPAARTRTDYAFGCRTYPNGTGVPSDEMILAALREANEGSAGNPAGASPREGNDEQGCTCNAGGPVPGSSLQEGNDEQGCTCDAGDPVPGSSPTRGKR